MKSFNVLPNSQIPFADDYVRIVCSVCNAFRPSLVKSLESDVVMAKRITALAKSPNKLQQKVTDNKRTMMVLYRSPDQTDLHIYC